MKKKLSSIICVNILILTSLAALSSGQDCLDLRKQSGYQPDEDVVAMIQQVNECLVFRFLDDLLDFGSRYTGSSNCWLAGEYIYDEFERMGLEIEFHEWRYARFKSRNVVATLNGVDSTSDAVFIMSAHYDCTPGSPGADDDASGVAALLTAAEIMSQYSFNHTIRFIAFSGEEVGTYGSFNYARGAYKRGDNIVGVLNADMVGYADTTEGGRILRFFHPERSAWIADFAETVSTKYMGLIDLSVESLPNYRGADHQAFVDYGYDGVWIAHHDSYPWANTPDDTSDHLNHTYQVKATKLLLAVLAELANKSIAVQVILKTPLEGYTYFVNRPVLPLSFGRKWYSERRGITIIFRKAIATAEVISDEEIEHVIFCIDDNFIYWDSEPPYEWRIQGKLNPLIGRYKLKVYAYTTSGKTATDEMDIIIYTLSYQYRRW